MINKISVVVPVYNEEKNIDFSRKINNKSKKLN